MNPIETLRADVRLYLKASGMNRTKLGKKALGDPNFVHDLLENGREPRWSTIDSFRNWMDANPAETVAA